MTLNEITNRLVELRSQIDSEGADLESIETEINNLLEEKRSLNEKAEKREALIQKALVEKTQTIESFEEERKEDNKMDVNYRSAFLRKLQLGSEALLTPEERALVTAAAVIPTETLNLIVTKLEQESVLLPYVTRTNFPNGLSIPVENAKNEAAWVAMGTAATDSADSWAPITLAAHKLIKTIEIGADVESMSIDAFEAYIVSALAMKLSRAIENAILNGSGSGQPTGLFLAGQVTQTETYTALGMTYPDLLKIVAKLPTAYHKGAKWVFTRDVFFNEVLGIVDGENRPIVLPLSVEGGAQFLLLGYPVIINDFVPEDEGLFGNFRFYHINFAKDFQVDKDSSAGFRTGSQVYRAMALADGKPTVAEAFVKFDRAAG
jgi:HK97 family phage major capsid protein